ncbi:class I SAM-dependent methyltransferase [Rhodospirillum sp. A1_3_36]|uniref:class I SAM-dependent methyltransferase n=1 Tax=Rhodospirillum sp. A1_3_36 TaxID=3391666 RepID=UPI0039A5974D
MSFKNYWQTKVINAKRLEHLPPRLAPHFDGTETVLDVGCANGQMALELTRYRPGLSVSGVDIFVPDKPLIPFTRYDGMTLPYGDNAFDSVTLLDVLHHDRSPERVLGEALRVSRRKVVIKDHFWRTRLDFVTLCYFDYVGNRLNGTPLPFSYQSMDGWRALFTSLGARLLVTETFRMHVKDPCKQVIFVLEKAPESAL